MFVVENITVRCGRVKPTVVTKATLFHGAVNRGHKIDGAVRIFLVIHGAVRCGVTVITKVTVFHGAV